MRSSPRFPLLVVAALAALPLRAQPLPEPAPVEVPAAPLDSEGAPAAPDAAELDEPASAPEAAELEEPSPSTDVPAPAATPLEPTDVEQGDAAPPLRAPEASAAPIGAPVPLPSFGETPLIAEGAALAAWSRCLEPSVRADTVMLRACLEAVIAQHPGTASAYRAEGALVLLSTDAPAGGLEIPAGRLELSSTAGLFGIWNGIAAGVALGAHIPETPPELGILGTGALAVGLGVGYGVGGYFLAEGLNLGEGASRLVASSLVWGTTYGIAAVPPLLELGLTGPLSVSLPLFTVVLGGFAGGALAVGVSQLTELSTPQVSLINTGGWMGALFGLLTLPNLAAFRVESPSVYSLSYITLGTLGLATGVVASRWLELTWGETLLLDLGAVIGLVAGGTAVFALNAAGAFQTLPGTVAVPLTTGGLALGALSGLALTGAGLALFRGPERPVFKLAGLDVEPVLNGPSVVLDLERQPVLVAPGPAFRF